MVVDTSAIVAILFGEAEAGRFAEMIEADPMRLISAASVLESALVVENELGEGGERELDLLLLTAGIEIVPFSVDHLRVARQAFRTFGKRTTPGRAQFRGLLQLRAEQNNGGAAVVQG
jgi:ribonuclease VapC